MELLWAGADAQARALRAGSVRAPELLDAVLARLREVDPVINAFRAVDESARAAAEAAQARLDAGESTPLLGVPIAVKDDIDVAGDVTAAGGRPQFPPATADSAAVARLRAAGAVIVGRTLTPDRCLWPFTESLTYGSTRNPWHLDHTPGGSSGGSAAAVAAGIVGVATGSDGGGSVRMPSCASGVFGLKTSRGLIPLAPLGEIWHGLAGLGALGRGVADAAAMIEVLAGEPGYRAAVDKPPAPLRIALAWNTPVGRPPMSAEYRRAVADTADRLRDLGHRVTEADVPLGARPGPQFMVRYLRGVADDVAGLPHPEWLEPRTRMLARAGARLPDRALAWARTAEAGLQARMVGFFTEHDLILQPGWVRRPPRVGRYHGSGASMTLAAVGALIPYFPTWNVLGYPVAALPVGLDDGGVPIGVQVIGPMGSEHLLLSLSGQYERAHPWTDRRPAL
ncbi:amidase family protein [Actinokineospora fastidiosa]|uniref:Amidase AmiB2 n=1 Tax=Actinokineospora fastidiosa TaxID=1816 RepID=A0A918GIC3_9PSEU|nr:amidase family protein [Actinokineospora fastidiosa]GGS40405.1 putative amidase AmiB2 [Actinokineospora fastidiosa]